MKAEAMSQEAVGVAVQVGRKPSFADYPNPISLRCGVRWPMNFTKGLILTKKKLLPFFDALF